MSRESEALQALSNVVDPELDEPITDLGFVHSLGISVGGDVEVHLRLPTSFCSPNFAYLMASDAKDALTELDWTRNVVVELDDHHDSPLINAGLAADAGYRGTFGHEALDSLDELRTTFHRKAHTAAMERCLTALVRAGRAETSLGAVTLADLPPERTTESLLRRRKAVGLSTEPNDLVLVDHTGHQDDDVVLALRRARSTRISIDGNAHFCRGLLKTRYDSPVRPSAEHTLIPLTSLQGASS
ncbi:metal-sulfur cluster biosynthetic enzyme [Mycobacterium sp. djl-10]|nr:metal-sulfur cluster biosynthetic enzyme [Mycobacterium sp. djl-10]